ncbi:MAG: hypothetical protein R3F29_06965 [Planctomycetota bacterium]
MRTWPEMPARRCRYDVDGVQFYPAPIDDLYREIVQDGMAPA